MDNGTRVAILRFNMKAFIKRTRNYYKYIYSNFEQPTLTANGEFGGDSMAVYHVFGGNNGSWGTTYTAFQPNGSRIGFYCDEWKSSMSLLNVNSYF